MIINASSQELATRIEQVVQEHLAASRKIARAAMERAFSASGETARQSQRTKQTTKKPVRRRTPGQMVLLSEQLYATMCKMPGETMMVLAGHVGVRARELKGAVKRLKRAGRLRCVGQRSHMRYFPMASEANVHKGANV